MQPTRSHTWEPRAVCTTCWRPSVVCYCAHLTRIETKTRVVILQHPRERDVAIGTARMASLCLPQATLLTGVTWEGSAELASALSDPSRPAALLYPGDAAIDVLAEPPRGPVTLVVVDGTWSQAKKLVRENPSLRALPRYAFTAPSPSEYRIRKEPCDAYVSTVEALVHVLGALEGDPSRFEALLAPFRAMVDAQLEHQRRAGRPRLRIVRPRAPKPRVPSLFRERWGDVVCVVGEANAWPHRGRKGEPSAYPDELVQWTAYRPSTGEAMDVVVAPRNPLAPRTPEYVDLDAALLARGASLETAHDAWRTFARPSDVVCAWGPYPMALFASEGGWLPDRRVDLRLVARGLVCSPSGTLEDFVATIAGDAPSPASPLARGRAGRRLRQIDHVVRHFRAASEDDAARAAAFAAGVP